MKVVGIAGAPGTGKSAAAEALAERSGIVWLDLDCVAWETYAARTPTYWRLVSRFGEAILDAKGNVNRASLARAAFSDPEALAALNEIVHPAVTKRLRDRIASERAGGTRFLLVEGALLGLSPHVDPSLLDAILWFTASPGTRAERLRRAGRGDHARRPTAPAPRGATPIDADGTLGQTVSQVDDVLASLSACDAPSTSPSS